MSPRRRVLRLWLVLGGLVAALLIPMWRPLRAAWHCTWLHENGVRERARVVEKFDDLTSFALMIEQGPHAGQACTADTSLAIYEETQNGDTLEVVYVDWKRGTCELSSTIEASVWVLRLVVGGLAR